MVSSSSFLRTNGAGANEDWPELIDVGKVGEVMTVKTVFEPPKPKTIALQNISDKDLKSLKKQDPFSYHTTPFPACEVQVYSGRISIPPI